MLSRRKRKKSHRIVQWVNAGSFRRGCFLAILLLLVLGVVVESSSSLLSSDERILFSHAQEKDVVRRHSIDAGTSFHARDEEEEKRQTIEDLQQEKEQQSLLSLSHQPNDGLIRLQLIPFHEQVRRRRRERERKQRELRTRRRLEEGQQNDPNNKDTEADEMDLDDAQQQQHLHKQRQRRQRLLQEEDKDNSWSNSPTNAAVVAELYQGYGTHYVDLWVGTRNPQRQTVIVDTGSSVTAFPCKGCRGGCGVPEYHAAPALFDPDLSGTFHALNCSECLKGHCSSSLAGDECLLSMRYAEGSSWWAMEVQDDCYVGGLHGRPILKDDNKDNNNNMTTTTTRTEEYDALNPLVALHFRFPLKFACQTSITGLFVSQVSCNNNKTCSINVFCFWVWFGRCSC